MNKLMTKLFALFLVLGLLCSNGTVVRASEFPENNATASPQQGTTIWGIDSLVGELEETGATVLVESDSQMYSEGVPSDYVEPEYIYTEEDIQKMRSSDMLIPQSTENATYVSYFSSLTDAQMQVVIASLKNGVNKIRTTYNGTECFAFTSGSQTIYIPSTQVYRTASGTCNLSTFNSTLTSYANAGNTAKVYTNIYRAYQYTSNGNTIYRLSIARISANAYYNSSNQLYFKIRVEDSLSVDVYATFIYNLTYQCWMQIKPTTTLKITNTGGSTTSLYMGGYELEGLGEDTSTTTMGSLISLGYKASQIYGTVTSGALTTDTLYSLYNDLVSITESTSSSRKYYVAEPECLSNPADKIYVYTCATTSPFQIRKANDYLILKIGLVGTPNSSTKYSINCSFSLTSYLT